MLNVAAVVVGVGFVAAAAALVLPWLALGVVGAALVLAGLFWDDGR